MAKVRINFDVSEEYADLIQELAKEAQLSKTEIVRRGISILKAYSEQKKAGRPHIGFTTDPSKLDSELIGLLGP